MNYVYDIAFWLTTALSIAAVAVLVASVKLSSKGWLLGFLILSLLSSAGFYFPMLLEHTGVITSDAYQKFIGSAAIAFRILEVSGWALLLGFVLRLKYVEERATATSNSAAGGHSGSGKVGLRIAAGVALVTGALVGQLAGGLTPGEAPIGLIVLACSVTAAVLAFRGSSARKTMIALVFVSLVLLATLTLANATHWRIAGVWLFDILALLLHGLGLVLLLSTPRRKGAV